MSTQAKRKVRVVLIEDSEIALEILTRILTESGEVDVVGKAPDGQQGLDLVEKTKPDVICTDLVMPSMDGLAFTEAVMQRCPRPILVISQHIDPQKHTDNIFNLMRAGALDFFEKPRSDTEAAYQSVQSILVNKIKALAYKASRYKS